MGNTPLLAVDYRYAGRPGRILVKAEYCNPSGSVKDRVALHLFRKAYAEGALRPGDPVAEVSRGDNLAFALASLGRAMGHPVYVYLPGDTPPGRVDALAHAGARVKVLGASEGGLASCLDRAREAATRDPRLFLPSRFARACLKEAHEAFLAPELGFQLEDLGLRPGALVAGVGSGGTLMGLGAYFRKRNCPVPLYPVNLQTASTRRHLDPAIRIHGLARPGGALLVPSEASEAPLVIQEDDAILMAQRLSSGLGVSVGVSSGANFLAAVRVQERLGKECVVATLFPDEGGRRRGIESIERPRPRIDHFSPFIQLGNLERVGPAA
jgi:cysteine synthase